MKNDLGNLIEVLYQISQHYGDDIPVSVNLYHDRKLALQSISLDTTDNELELLIEADLEDNRETSNEFMLGNNLTHLITNRSENLNPNDFLWDNDKMYDLLTVTKEVFLNKYLYVSEKDYDLTLSLIKPSTSTVEDNEEKISNLADLCREAENLYIEELNGRSTDWVVLGSQLKEAIYDFARENYSEAQQELFNEYCSNMGV